MSALVVSSLWRAPTLMLMAALTFAACAPAQEEPSAAAVAASKDGAPVSAEQTLTRVRALRGAKRFAAMLEPLETYLASDPRNTLVRLEYARSLAILRRFPEATREYRRVLESEPQNAAALIGLAKVASWQGQNQLALEIYNRVLARKPEPYDALVGKAFVLLWMGRQEEARMLFRDAQRRHPDDLEVGRTLTSLEPPTSLSMRADAAADAPRAAANDANEPAVSDASTSAPVEASKPAMTPSPATTSSTAAHLPDAAPGAAVEEWNGSEMTQGTTAAPASSPGPPPPQKSSAPPRSKGAREHAQGRIAEIQQQSSPPAAPKGPPSPLRIPLGTALQLAVLGMVAVVVGAIAYRTYTVRLHSEALLPRRAYELPPASLVPPPRPEVACAGRGGPLAGRVLVVHPQQAVREFAHQVLAGAGAEVLALGRGEDAMVRLDRAQYDAIVVSDQLPAGWSGREIYHWLAQNQPGAERKFVLALAEEADAEMQLFLEESRALTISTPFGVSDLLAMTRLAMARSRAQA